MDILQSLIKSLEKEELKSYKLYTKRTHNFDERKDIELFESIKKHPTELDAFHFNSIYNGTKPDNRYYRLKNKITDDIAKVLSNLNYKKTENEVVHLIGLAKIFIVKSEQNLALHYLKLAERRALDKEDYALLEVIYEHQLKINLQQATQNPKEIVLKRNENSQRLRLLQELENNLSVLSYEVKTTQNITTNKEVLKWLNNTLTKTTKLPYVKNSVQLRIKLFQNLSRLMLLLKDYQSLESYLKNCLNEFETDNLFTKQTHEIKLQLLVYLGNASFMLNKHKQSVETAVVLYKAIFEFDKLYYNQYVFYYYNILVYSYSKTNPLKAIETLESAQNETQIKNNPSQYFYILNNLALVNFDLKRFKLVSKYFSQMYVSENFKTLDVAFIIKLYVFELINKLELEEFEMCEKQLVQIKKITADTKDKESIAIDLSVLILIEQFILTYNKRWRPLKSNIVLFLKQHNDTLNAGLLGYCNWLESKI